MRKKRPSEAIRDINRLMHENVDRWSHIPGEYERIIREERRFSTPDGIIVEITDES